LEQVAAEALGGLRIDRRWNLFESAPDVVAPDFKLVVDCKAHQRFTHHTLMENIQQKYCDPGDIPVLVTQHAGQQDAYVTVPLGFLSQLLERVRRMNLPGRTDSSDSARQNRG
jgi:hypothetical protein